MDVNALLDTVTEGTTETELRTILESAGPRPVDPTAGIEVTRIHRELTGKEVQAMNRELYGDGLQPGILEYRPSSQETIVTLEVTKRRAHCAVWFVEGVCVATDIALWNNPDFLQVIIWDSGGICRGGVHFLFHHTPEGCNLILPGIDPANALLQQVDAQQILDVVIDFAWRIAGRSGRRSRSGNGPGARSRLSAEHLNDGGNMSTLDLIESLGELRRRMSGLSLPEDYDGYLTLRGEIISLLRRLTPATLDDASIAALRVELPEVFPLDPDFHGFVFDLLRRLGPPDEATQELCLRTLDARGDRKSPYRMATGDYLGLMRLLENADSPMMALVGPLRTLFAADPVDGPVSVQDTELQLRAARILLDWNGPEKFGAAMEARFDTPSFRMRIVELMKAEPEWRMHYIANPDELQELYSRLSEVSAPFARLVDRYHARIRNGEEVLTCPKCGEYGVFALYRGIPTETIRERVRCEQCGAELVLEISEEVQAPGHEEHARARFSVAGVE